MSKNFTELNTQEMNEVNGGSVVSQTKELLKEFAGSWVSGCRIIWNGAKEFVHGLFD